ncbi:hypothetical protein CKY10_22435 [Photorhabdus sp. HUG-39]|uniref:Uncharacterized protein n=1 Tax=Photorhabdus kayaii TaxID=230088 RepID=A0ABX0B9Y8_9GAMM|nr:MULTISPECIES: hypothetical protein [Photorhabdus]MCC8375779.1 hypothetical protein [Photorhabdus bodei]NDL14350.1 hypothetical protein [Photorhabdus kayaii]NDL27867.1 hypothetical protein [Photorhabdus kayaii]RAX06532.1 hypothetical protein CKY10_22435 [Photorhabdus sp. HUG-39]
MLHTHESKVGQEIDIEAYNFKWEISPLLVNVENLKPEALMLVEEQLKAVTMLANSCADYKDFESRCMSAFGVKGQLKLIYPAA